MLQIVSQSSVPNSTYFRTEDVEPELAGSELTVLDGEGTRRSWGAPGVTSTVILNSDDLAAVHVGYHHKHRGGQFWRYYRLISEQWSRVDWAKLDDEARSRILDAAEQKAPSWAKTPGKLRTQYALPTLGMTTAYKIVQVVDEHLFSVYDGKTEYIIGKRLSERAQDDHEGGYYSYHSIDDLKARFEAHALFPERCYEEPMTLAVIECEVGGNMIEYPNGKRATTYLRPVAILEQFAYMPVVAA